MDASSFEYELQIKEYHLDTFGHVNNATYLNLLEEARWDFITRNGFGLERIKKELKGPVILDVNLKFKKEILNREWVKIISMPRPLTHSKVMSIHQEIIKKDSGKVAAEADFSVGFFDMKERKLITPDPEWLKALGL